MFYVLTSRILPKWWLIMHDPKALCRIYPVCIMPSLTAFRRDPSCQRLSQIACLLNTKVWQKFLQTSHVGQPLASSKALGINPYLIFISCTQMVSHFYDLVTQYRKKKSQSQCLFFYSFCPDVPIVIFSAEQNEELGLLWHRSVCSHTVLSPFPSTVSFCNDLGCGCHFCLNPLRNAFICGLGNAWFWTTRRKPQERWQPRSIPTVGQRPRARLFRDRKTREVL